MKLCSVSQLLGVCVLLLCVLMVSAVVSFLPPSRPNQPLLNFLVVLPFFASTVLMVSIHSRIKLRRTAGTGHPPLISMETSPYAEGQDEDYDDVVAAVTTEHEF